MAKFKTCLLAGAGFVAGGMFPVAAFAQHGPDSSEAGVPDGGGNEIVVTATRRATSLQDTALPVSAISGEEFEARGVASVSNYLTAVPGVDVSSVEPGAPSIVIRGIGTGFNSTIGLYLDDSPVSIAVEGGATTPDIRLIDMERVEVLKGPQGTSYGASAMGGVIRYITNKPDTTAVMGGVSGTGSQIDGGGFGYELSGYINVPVNDDLAIRAVGYRSHGGGFIDGNRPTPKKNINSEETVGGRLALAWSLSDRLSLDVSYLYQDTEVGSESTATPVYTPLPVYEFPVVLPADYTPVDLDNPHLLTQETDEPYGRTYEIFNANLGYQFDTFDVSLLASKREIEYRRREQVGKYVDLFIEPPIPTTDRSFFSADTLELRAVSSDSDSRFSWIAGAFYQKSSNHYTLYTVIPDDFPPTLLFGFIPINPGAVTDDVDNRRSVREIAGYGELGVRLLDDLTLTLGYRHSNLNIKSNLRSLITASLNVSAAEDTQSVDVYHANLEYRPAENVLLFANAASGYRLGGINIANGLIGLPQTEYTTDTIWNYELGMRSNWFDGRLEVNAFAYRIDWSDMQFSVNNVDTLFVSRTLNIGKSRIYGFELEASFAVTNDLSLGFDGSFVDAELKEDFPSGGAVSGDRLPLTARTKYALFLDWSRPVGDGYELSLRGTHRFVGKRLNDFAGGARPFSLPSYTLTDARVTLESERGWNVSVFADNLFNNIGVSRVVSQGSVHGKYRLANKPRTVGVSFGYDF